MFNEKRIKSVTRVAYAHRHCFCWKQLYGGRVEQVEPNHELVNRPIAEIKCNQKTQSYQRNIKKQSLEKPLPTCANAVLDKSDKFIPSGSWWAAPVLCRNQIGDQYQTVQDVLLCHDDKQSLYVAFRQSKLLVVARLTEQLQKSRDKMRANAAQEGSIVHKVKQLVDNCQCEQLCVGTVWADPHHRLSARSARIAFYQVMHSNVDSGRNGVQYCVDVGLRSQGWVIIPFIRVCYLLKVQINRSRRSFGCGETSIASLWLRPNRTTRWPRHCQLNERGVLPALGCR